MQFEKTIKVYIPKISGANQRASSRPVRKENVQENKKGETKKEKLAWQSIEHREKKYSEVKGTYPRASL